MNNSHAKNALLPTSPEIFGHEILYVPRVKDVQIEYAVNRIWYRIVGHYAGFVRTAQNDNTQNKPVKSYIAVA